MCDALYARGMGVPHTGPPNHIRKPRSERFWRQPKPKERIAEEIRHADELRAARHEYTAEILERRQSGRDPIGPSSSSSSSTATLVARTAEDRLAQLDPKREKLSNTDLLFGV